MRLYALCSIHSEDKFVIHCMFSAAEEAHERGEELGHFYFVREYLEGECVDPKGDPIYIQGVNE